MFLYRNHIGITYWLPLDSPIVTASMIFAYIAITGAYLVTSTDYTIDCTSNSFTVTLPSAVGLKGKPYEIKNTGNGIITVTANGIETIDDINSQIIPPKSCMTIKSTGTSWIIT